MPSATRDLALPRWRATRWLVATRDDVPNELRPALVQGLYGSVPIFLGGVLNTVLVSTIVGIRNPTPLFLVWAALEILLAFIRLPLLVIGLRAMKRGGRSLIDLYLLMALAWAASVGFGTLITLLSGDWVAATLACLSAAAMVGGIAFRNFGAPRLVAAMILLSLGPCVIGGALSGEPLLLATVFQIPMYIFAMSSAAYRLNRMLVRTMQSDRENRHRARHDALTGLLNRVGLEEAVRRRLGDRAGARGTTLFCLDLDGFKSVNDTLGHAAGDRLLAMVAERLRGLFGAEDAVARMGGDEFVVVTGFPDGDRAVAMGQLIVDRLSGAPYFIGDEAVMIGASAGIAQIPAHGDSVTALLLAADRALYEAKSQGGARCALAGRAPVGSFAPTPKVSEPVSALARLDLSGRVRPAAPPRAAACGNGRIVASQAEPHPASSLA